MVHFKTAAFGLIAALLSGMGEAFSPSASNPAAKKVELARAKVEKMFPNMNMAEGMNMVAGGAQAEEYYEGEHYIAFASFEAILLRGPLPFLTPQNNTQSCTQNESNHPSYHRSPYRPPSRSSLPPPPQ